jgi:hypothetical protein
MMLQFFPQQLKDVVFNGFVVWHPPLTVKEWKQKVSIHPG